MPKGEEMIYETRALRKQEEMGCKVKGLVVGRRRPLVYCDRREADQGHAQAVGWDAGCWVTSCQMDSLFLKDTERRDL